MWIDYIKAFLIGGAICAICQVFIDRTKITAGRILAFLVTLGVVLSAAGLYKPFADFAGAGASVPLLGFGHTLCKGVFENVDKYGLLGAFTGGVTAAAAGITAAILFGYITALLFRSRMKE